MTDRLDVTDMMRRYGYFNQLKIDVEPFGFVAEVAILIHMGWKFFLRGKIHRRYSFPSRLVMIHKTSGIMAASDSMPKMPLQGINFWNDSDKEFVLDCKATMSNFEGWLCQKTIITMPHISHQKKWAEESYRVSTHHVVERKLYDPLSFTKEEIPAVMERVIALQEEDAAEARRNIERRNRIAQGSNSVKFNIDELKRKLEIA